MKARIKKTGEVINIAPYATVELDVCDSRGNPITKEFEEVELVQDNDLSAFRREAAKDILVGLCANNNLGFYGNSNTELATSAIALADELIKQLKQQ